MEVYTSLTNSSSVMLCPEDQFWCSIPDCHYHLITAKQPSLRQWFVPQSGKTQVANLNHPS